EKRAGFDHEFGLDGSDEGAQKFQHLGLGRHGVVHAPALGVRTLGRGAVILRQQRALRPLGLQHDLVFLLQFLAKQRHCHRPAQSRVSSFYRLSTVARRTRFLRHNKDSWLPSPATARLLQSEPPPPIIHGSSSGPHLFCGCCTLPWRTPITSGWSRTISSSAGRWGAWLARWRRATATPILLWDTRGP